MDRLRISGYDVSLEHSEEKVKLPKESLTIDKHKRSRLRQKPATGKMNTPWFSRNWQSVARAGDSGRGKLKSKKYSAKKRWKRRQSYKRSSRC